MRTHTKPLRIPLRAARIHRLFGSRSRSFSRPSTLEDIFSRAETVWLFHGLKAHFTDCCLGWSFNLFIFILVSSRNRQLSNLMIQRLRVVGYSHCEILPLSGLRVRSVGAYAYAFFLTLSFSRVMVKSHCGYSRKLRRVKTSIIVSCCITRTFPARFGCDSTTQTQHTSEK